MASLVDGGEQGDHVASYPILLHTAIDARDCHALAEFYHQFSGFHYREGQEPPTDGTP